MLPNAEIETTHKPHAVGQAQSDGSVRHGHAAHGVACRDAAFLAEDPEGGGCVGHLGRRATLGRFQCPHHDSERKSTSGPEDVDGLHGNLWADDKGGDFPVIPQVLLLPRVLQ